MDLGLGDKVVVITGTSKGIGLAMVEAFAGEGARVVAGSRTKGEALRELSRGYPVVPVAVDLGAPEGPGELVGRAVEEFGGVDVLVNNVGAITPRGGFLSVGDEDWRWAIEMNLMTAVRASRAALPIMGYDRHTRVIRPLDHFLLQTCRFSMVDQFPGECQLTAVSTNTRPENSTEPLLMRC